MRRIIAVWLVIMMIVGGMIGIVNLSTDAEEVGNGDAETRSASQSKSGLTPHAPIYINGNSEFTSANGVTSGSGTGTDPYVIENYDINASSANGIEVRNTDTYFIIRNCVIHDGGGNKYDGIFFYYVQNGEINNVTFHNNWYGIHLFNYRSNNNTITNCAAYNNLYGIILGSNNIVSNCDVYNNSNDGIKLWSSSNNSITNCTVYNNDDHGILLDYHSNNNIVSSCNVYNNSGNGIYLYRYSDNNQITNCAVYNNSWSGILLEVEHSSNINTITNCLIYNNYYGISLWLSSNIDITNCAVYNNSMYGIYLGSSSYNLITNCAVYNNFWGIYLYSSSNNQITNCAVYNNNWTGICLNFSSYNNQVTYCNITDNIDYGVYIPYNSFWSEYNIFHHNNFINNSVNAYDIWTNTNYWDDGSEGNYWSDYTGSDENADGIGDTRYSISGGSNKDHYPLMNPVEDAGVLPWLSVSINVNPTTVNSTDILTITIAVTDSIDPVSNATTNLQSDNGGSFSSVTDNGDGTYTATFTAPTVTVLTVCKITAEVTKAGYITDSSYVKVRVNPVAVENHVPVVNSITANQTTVNTGETVTVSVDATDEDTGDVLTYVYSCTGGIISGTGNIVTWAAPNTAGSYTVSVYVSDGPANSNSKSVTITVTDGGGTTDGGEYGGGEKEEEKGFIPGFEVAAFLVAMIGVCIILLRRRKDV